MALHLLQGGLGGETLFILEYAHAGGGEVGCWRRDLLSHCTAGAKGLYLKEDLTQKWEITLHLLNLICVWNPTDD